MQQGHEKKVVTCSGEDYTTVGRSGKAILLTRSKIGRLEVPRFAAFDICATDTLSSYLRRRVLTQSRFVVSTLRKTRRWGNHA